MNSKHFKEDLSAFLDKELNGEEMKAVEEHLANCKECREEFQALQDTVHMLSSMEEVIPPASFRYELRKKLDGCNKKPGFSLNALISRWIETLKQRRLMPVAVVIVLAIVIIPFAGANLPKMGGARKAADSSVAIQSPSVNKQLASEEQMRKMKAPDGRGETTYESAAPEAAMSGSGQMNDITSKPIEDPNQTYSIIEPNIERKIIKNADIMLQVDDYSIAAEAIKQKAASLGGYVSNESVNTMGREVAINGYLQVRIPALGFDSFLSGVEGLGKLKNRNVYSQDVTEEYVDVESRLKALRTKEERLLAILNKSGQLNDVLAVENELANTRAQLESLQGRLRYLDNRADFSSISINIEQLVASTKEITNPGFKEIMQKTKEAFIETINTIILGVGELIVFLGSAIPYLLLMGIAAWLVWWFVLKKKI